MNKNKRFLKTISSKELDQKEVKMNSNKGFLKQKIPEIVAIAGATTAIVGGSCVLVGAAVCVAALTEPTPDEEILSSAADTLCAGTAIAMLGTYATVGGLLAEALPMFHKPKKDEEENDNSMK